MFNNKLIATFALAAAAVLPASDAAAVACSKPVPASNVPCIPASGGQVNMNAVFNTQLQEWAYALNLFAGKAPATGVLLNSNGVPTKSTATGANCPKADDPNKADQKFGPTQFCKAPRTGSLAPAFFVATI